jgi:hypothetical protein
MGDTACLRIAGDVTSASEAELTGAFAASLDDGARAVVLDFAAMEYMNSGGIGLLVTLLVRAQRSGAPAARDRPVGHYRADPVAPTRLDEAIEILPDEAAAMAAVAAMTAPRDYGNWARPVDRLSAAASRVRRSIRSAESACLVRCRGSASSGRRRSACGSTGVERLAAGADRDLEGVLRHLLAEGRGLLRPARGHCSG